MSVEEIKNRIASLSPAEQSELSAFLFHIRHAAESAYREEIASLSAPVSKHSEVLGGEAVFVGTRVPIRSLFDHLEAGDSVDDFLEGFPSVRREQAVAVIEEARERSLAAS